MAWNVKKRLFGAGITYNGEITHNSHDYHNLIRALNSDKASTQSNLIKSAPDLLAALKGCIDSLEFSITELRHEIPNEDMEMMMDRVANARAAIAKAEDN